MTENIICNKVQFMCVRNMDCEKCPIREECEKDKLAYFEGRPLAVRGSYACPLAYSARMVTGLLKQYRELSRE
jgi:hypothetical protein